MRIVLIAALAGCSFQPGTPPEPQSAADAAIDGPPGSSTSDGGIVGCSDDDGDGVCNAVDDWPCGGKPSPPPAKVTITEKLGGLRLEISLVGLTNTGLLAVAAPGQSVQLHLHYELVDYVCAGSCREQVEIGWVPGRRVGCVFDQAVMDNTMVAGNIDAPITAPDGAQPYDLRVNVGFNTSCNGFGADNWWGGTPDSDQTIAKLCVH